MALEMLEYRRGDLFSSDCRTLVNTVNCVGVMGAGVAKRAKELFPEMYDDYVGRCNRGEVRPGVPYYWTNPDPGSQSIVNFPTKNHWKARSRFEWIEQGLRLFVDSHVTWGVESVAFPALGCGKGGLVWNDVRHLMRGYLSRLPIRVEVYYPPELTKTEKAIESVQLRLERHLGAGLRDLAVRRSLRTDREAWTDWRRAKRLDLVVHAEEGADADLLRELERLVFNNYGVEVKMELAWTGSYGHASGDA